MACVICGQPDTTTLSIGMGGGASVTTVTVCDAHKQGGEIPAQYLDASYSPVDPTTPV